MSALTLVGRSSSHYTRITRIFALELGVAFEFRPVLDITAIEASAYAGNPALKVPILVDEHGALFGTENICRELVRRSGRAASVVQRGESNARVVLNAEELVLHVMSSEVSVIMAKMAGDARLAPAKVSRSIQNSLAHLEEHVGAVLAALPAERAFSFVEVALFSVVTHLPFRDVTDVTPYAHLRAFCTRFGERASALATEYRFDKA